MVFLDSTEDENLKRFTTYNNYLNAISSFLNHEYRDINNFIANCKSVVTKNQKQKNYDNKNISRLLNNSWTTEFLLNQKYPDDEIKRILNAWLPIQAYYSIYSMAEIIGMFCANKAIGNHKETLRIVTNRLSTSGLCPWNFVIEGYLGKNQDQQLRKNFPRNIKFENNLKSGSHNYLGMIATCLNAEHKHRVDDKWKNEKHFSSEKRGYRYKYLLNPGQTSILHFLYRLRLKCNYGEIVPFIMTSGIKKIDLFSENIKKICEWTLIYFELFIVSKIGFLNFKDFVDSYLKLNPNAKYLLKRLNSYH